MIVQYAAERGPVLNISVIFAAKFSTATSISANLRLFRNPFRYFDKIEI